MGALCCPADVAENVDRGQALRCGVLARRGGLFNETWEKKWFVLFEEGSLAEYEDRGHFAARTAPLHVVDLVGAACVFVMYPKVPMHMSSMHCMEIVASKESLFVFADTPEEIRAWARDISRLAIERSIKAYPAIRNKAKLRRTSSMSKKKLREKEALDRLLAGRTKEEERMELERLVREVEEADAGGGISLTERKRADAQALLERLHRDEEEDDDEAVGAGRGEEHDEREQLLL